MKISGGCLCGKVRYEGEGEPMFAAKCHCTDCRHACGSGHAALAGFKSDAVKMTGDVQGFDLKADSGSTVTHHFCPNCGVRVFNSNSAMPGASIIYLTTLDDPESLLPAVSIFTDSALGWDHVDPSIPQFAKMPDAG